MQWRELIHVWAIEIVQTVWIKKTNEAAFSNKIYVSLIELAVPRPQSVYSKLAC